MVRSFLRLAKTRAETRVLGQTYIDPTTDIHAVCGVVKYWFRVLPETAIPEVFFDPVVEAASKSRDSMYHHMF